MPQTLVEPEVYGPHTGHRYIEAYDADGIKLSPGRPQTGDGLRVLVLGDSFMQGYDDPNTVPQVAWQWISRQPDAPAPLLVLNAGHTSYSPLIHTVQARRLLPLLRPDFVVADVDETDFFDDTVKYRRHAQRDADGAVIAVPGDPDLIALRAGGAAAACAPLRLLRVVGRLYYRARTELYLWRNPPLPRRFDVATTSAGERPPELLADLAYFETSLEEYFRTLTRYVPADRILIVRHPHRQHLTTSSGGRRWNRDLGALVAAAARRHGMHYYDSQDELEARFGGHAERYYWANDMHFNFDGIHAYGELVGRELLQLISTARRAPARGEARSRA